MAGRRPGSSSGVPHRGLTYGLGTAHSCVCPTWLVYVLCKMLSFRAAKLPVGKDQLFSLPGCSQPMLMSEPSPCLPSHLSSSQTGSQQLGPADPALRGVAVNRCKSAPCKQGTAAQRLGSSPQPRVIYTIKVLLTTSRTRWQATAKLSTASQRPCQRLHCGRCRVSRGETVVTGSKEGRGRNT